MERTAIISLDGKYRYHLSREWDVDPFYNMVFVMLNPSTADAEVDDATIRRCISFAQREGCSRLDVVNLFAYRSTKPEKLLEVEDPIGPMNRSAVARFISTGHIVVLAWGAWWKKISTSQRGPGLPRLNVEGMTSRELYCLGTTKDGSPRHPLYVRGDAPLVTYRAAK